MFKFLNKKKNNKGFSLVELVIVIAILAILVGILAPQYTKYVEKSRKAADASNMDEMVKVVKVFAADPANELAAGKYTITINYELDSKVGTKIESAALKDGAAAPDKTGLEGELTDSIPKWNETVTKSKKWGEDGTKAAISATVTVNEDGGTSVEYSGTKFANYMAKGEIK